MRDLLAGLDQQRRFGRKRVRKGLTSSDANALRTPLLSMAVASDAALGKAMAHAVARRTTGMGAAGAKEHARRSHLLCTLAVECRRVDEAATVRGLSLTGPRRS